MLCKLNILNFKLTLNLKRRIFYAILFLIGLSPGLTFSQQYSPDTNTIGLWHMSGNGYNLSISDGPEWIPALTQTKTKLTASGGEVRDQSGSRVATKRDSQK